MLNMMKILLDADASIKLAKIGIIETFAAGFEVIITADVYGEQGHNRIFQ